MSAMKRTETRTESVTFTYFEIEDDECVCGDIKRCWCERIRIFGKENARRDDNCTADLCLSGMEFGRVITYLYLFVARGKGLIDSFGNENTRRLCLTAIKGLDLSGNE